MNPDTTSTHNSLESQTSHGYASSGSESRKAVSSSTKKRASRAGTRSVTTLSAAQLERKRANDREAQRAIRQRTKDHIDNLEKSISDLRCAQESNEKMVVVTQQRNRELEDENAFLRTRLGDPSYGLAMPASESQRPTDAALLSVRSPSPTHQATLLGSSIHRPASTSAPRSLSMTTTQSSHSRHSSLQQPSSYIPSAPSSTSSILSTGSVAQGPNLTTWRSHESGQNIHAPMQVQDLVHNHPPMPAYGQSNPAERVEWASQQYPYTHMEQQQARKYESHPPHGHPVQPHQPYGHTPVQSFTSATGPTAQLYHPPQLPPQAEFQNMTVTSPAAYHAQQQQGFPPPAPYQMTPMQIAGAGAGYVSPHMQLQPHGVPTTTYHAPPSEQHYTPQPTQPPQPPMMYRDESAGRSYAVPHYTSG